MVNKKQSNWIGWPGLIYLTIGLTSLFFSRDIANYLKEKTSKDWKSSVAEKIDSWQKREMKRIYFDYEELGETYVVEQGDTLSEIANYKFNMSIDEIKKINQQIKDYDFIKVGDKINIINYAKGREGLDEIVSDCFDVNDIGGRLNGE